MHVLARRNHAAIETQRISHAAQTARELIAGRYEIMQRIGHSGAAELFTARDRKLGRTVAIKRPRRGAAGDVALADRLQREALALALIDSPHVVAIHDVGHTPRGVYLVLQHRPGGTLDDVIAERGPATAERACRIARDILTGLAAVHTAGLIHRDLKPSNVQLGADDRAMVLDLGAALHPRRRSATAPGEPAGDGANGAPFTIAASDGRTDLFQVGLILILLVTGTMAWRAVDPDRLAIAPELRGVIARAMAPLDERFESALDMRRAIDQALQALAACGHKTVVPASPSRTTLRGSGPVLRP